MFIDHDGITLFTTAFGRIDAPPLLALSGWIGTWEDWVDTFSVLSEGDWRLIGYDHRGSGATIAPVASITFDKLVDDVFAVLDAYGIERCVLAAMSMGTAVALAAIQRQIERFSGLIIVNGVYFRETPLTEDPFYAGLQKSYSQALDHFVNACVPEPESDVIKHWGRQILDRAAPEAALRLYEIGAEIDQRAILSQITVPTLILHGDADPLVSTATARSLAAALPNARLVILPGAGHVPIMTRPHAIAAEINAFFKKRSS
ncbi:MAG: alpha/beta hydrolase [Anaerolineae bacterium]|nr:alpha/beta hydrolase [Anaerolineae bacterium]